MDGLAIWMADNFLWTDGSAVRTAKDFGMYIHVLKPETTKQNDKIELELSKHCISIA